MAKQQTPAGPDPVMQGVTDLSRRLRVLEERYTVLRRKGQLAEENLLSDMQDLQQQLKNVSSEATELRRLLVDVDDKIDRFLEQVKTAASREDVLIIKKYLELWDPVKYLTREEAQRLLEKRGRKV